MSLRARSAPSKQTPVSDPTPTTTDDSPPETPKSQPQPPLPSPSIAQHALTSTANLANLLPTGTLLAFQFLTPVFTNNGLCDSTTRPMTLLLHLLLAVSCLLACFTDSFRAADGQVFYGFAMAKGLWLFDYWAASGGPPPDLGKYRLSFIDFVHAIISVLVFVAVALRDRNVLRCFYTSQLPMKPRRFWTLFLLELVSSAACCLWPFQPEGMELVTLLQPGNDFFFL